MDLGLRDRGVYPFLNFLATRAEGSKQNVHPPSKPKNFGLDFFVSHFFGLEGGWTFCFDPSARVAKKFKKGYAPRSRKPKSKK